MITRERIEQIREYAMAGKVDTILVQEQEVIVLCDAALRSVDAEAVREACARVCDPWPGYGDAQTMRIWADRAAAIRALDLTTIDDATPAVASPPPAQSAEPSAGKTPRTDEVEERAYSCDGSPDYAVAFVEMMALARTLEIARAQALLAYEISDQQLRQAREELAAARACIRDAAELRNDNTKEMWWSSRYAVEIEAARGGE